MDQDSFLPDVSVYSPGGVKLCQASNSYPSEIASCDLPFTGTYSILVGDLLGIRSGAYRLFLQSLNNPPCPLPVFLPLILK